MYLYATPDDGWAYTPIELEALWAIPVDVEAIANDRTNVFAFHEYLASDGHAADKDAADLILRDSLAQYEDPAPPDLPEVCRLCGSPWYGTRTSAYADAEFTLCCHRAVRSLSATDLEADGA